MKPKETIYSFDAFLARRGLRLEAVVIGGAALHLLGIVSRQTRDCDILHPKLSPEILAAAKAFALEREQQGDPLAEDWLNNGPESLADVLPAGWMDRLQEAYRGKAILFKCLGRQDLLMSKLFALCDRGIDLPDLIALVPTSEELVDILPWLELQDANPGWPDHVRAVVDHLRGRLTDGL